MEELQVIETTSGRQFKPWATKDDVQDPASITAIASEIASGKQAIASAINAKGVTASATESFQELAEDVSLINFDPNGGVEWSNTIPATPLTASDVLANRDYIVKLTMNIETLKFGFLWNMPLLQELDLPATSNLTTSGSNFTTLRLCPNLRILRLSTLPSLPYYAIALDHLQELYIPGAYYVSLGLNSTSELRILDMLNVTSYATSYNPLENCPYLIDIITGRNISTYCNLLRNWSPTYAMDDTLSTLVKEGEGFANNREKLLYNIREHIAANLPVVSNGESFVFHSNLKALILADSETTNAFTTKGWTIA